jgi:hypothetical protein
MPRRHLLPPLLALLALTACGGDDDGVATPDAALADAAPPDGPPGTPTTVDAFCHEVATRLCAGLGSCGCRFDVRPYDATTCVEARTAACVTGAAPIAADIAAGRAGFVEPRVAACYADTDALAAACTINTGFGGPLPASCSFAIVSTAALGAPCQLSTGGLAFCAGGTGVCADVCTALPAPGEPCLGDSPGFCGPELVCDGGNCTAPRAAGAACAAVDACADGLVCDTLGSHSCVAPLAATAACESTRQCATGLACSVGACTALAGEGDGCGDVVGACGAGRGCEQAPETRTCGTPDAAGEMCMSDDTCVTGLDCDSNTHVCTAPPGENQPCPDRHCAAGLTCSDGKGTCIALPGLGEPCANGDRFCADGLGCDFSDNTCEPGPGVGEPCLLNPPDQVCAPGLACSFIQGVGSICVERGGVGTPCTESREECTADTYCEGSTQTCAARLADGAACHAGAGVECLAGHDCRRVHGEYRCAPVPAAGEPCESACAAGSVCKGLGGECAPALCTIP